MKPTAIVACATAAVGLWSCAAVAAATAAASDAGRRQSKAAELPSLDEMVQIVEAQQYLTSVGSDLIGSVTSGKVFDFYGPLAGFNGPVVGRGKKPKPAKLAMAMAGTAVMSMLLMKSMGAIMMFIVHSFFATKLGLIVAAYLLLCKLAEMKKAPAKPVIKWSSSPPSSTSYDEQPPPLSQMMLAGGPYPDSVQSSYAADPLQQQDLFQQQPPQQQQPSGQYGVPSQHQQQQQYSAPADFGGGGGGGLGIGGGDFMQAHYSNVSPVTYRPPINKSVVAENAAKSTATTGRL